MKSLSSIINYEIITENVARRFKQFGGERKTRPLRFASHDGGSSLRLYATGQ